MNTANAESRADVMRRAMGDQFLARFVAYAQQQGYTFQLASNDDQALRTAATRSCTGKHRVEVLAMTRRNRSGDRPKSAADLMAELQREPEFLARQRQQEVERQGSLERYRTAAGDVLADLAAVGFEVATIGELRRLGTPYPKAVPVLMRWLPRIQDAAVKEDIIRTLSVPWATDAATLLLAEFEQAEDSTGTGLGWALGNALEVVATDRIAEAMIKLASDRRYGKAREMIVLGLGKLTDPRVTNVLISLLADEEVVGHAVTALGKLRAKPARARIETLLRHPNAWVRGEAKKALRRIDQAA